MLDRTRAQEVAPPLAPQPAAADGVLPVEASDIAFARGGRTLVDGIDFRLEDQGITLVMGPNGAGKSLLLRLLAGLIAPDRGTVTWHGTAPDRARAPRIGFVFQKPVLLRRSALANIVHALKACGVPRSERKARALEALDLAHLRDLAGMPARLMSGGEQQRLALVRALAARPQVLLLDEPTASLDPSSAASIEALVLAAACAGTRIMFVSHDLGQARRLADEVVFMHRGTIVERSPARSFFENPRSTLAERFLAGHLLVDDDRNLNQRKGVTI